MKKSFLALTAAATAVLVSCNRLAVEDGQCEDPGIGTIHLEASFDGDTRTSIDSEGHVDWCKGDVIRYYSKDATKVRTHTIEEAGHTMSFDATLDGTDYLIAVNGGTSVSGVSSTGFTVSGVLGQKQSGEFGDSHLSVAKTDLSTNQLYFLNVEGCLKFSIADKDVAMVKLTSNGGEPLCGAGTIKVDMTGEYPAATYYKEYSNVTINATASGEYYFLTLPVELSKGFEMKLYDVDSCYIGKVEYDQPLKIERSKKKDLGQLDSQIKYAPRIGLIHYGRPALGWYSYKNCINDAGGRLVYLDHYAKSKTDARSLLKDIDAVIDPGSSSGDTTSRGTYDNYVVRVARETGKPILGICYGHQRVNTVLGGKNATVTTEYGTSITHKLSLNGVNVGLHNPEYFHKIIIDRTSTLYRLLGVDEIMVNTSHKYSTHVISDSLKVIARAPDGVVESLEGERFLGVQFHPEYLYGCHHDERFLPIFEYLVQMAEENKK